MSFQLPAPGSVQQSIGVLNKPIRGGAGQLESLVHAQLHTWNIPQAGGRTNTPALGQGQLGQVGVRLGQEGLGKMATVSYPLYPPALNPLG